MIMSIGWRHDPELRLPHHRGALALFAAAQAGASSALALANMAHEPRRGSASGAEIDAPSAQQPTLRSPPAKRGSASDAAHPAWSSGDAAESPQSNLSDHAPELAVGFYNLGIQLSEIGGPKWRQKQPQLTSDLVTAFVTHELDILCLSELGELGVGLKDKIKDGDIDGWIRLLLDGSAVPPVDIYTNGNYTTIVAKSDRVEITEHKLVTGFVPHQPERCYQHFRVRLQRDGDAVSIINCHAPSSFKRKLNNDSRRNYFRSFHCVSSPDRLIWGGDFNTKLIMISTLMEELDPRYTSKQGETSSAAQPGSTHSAAQPAGLNFIFSHPVGWKHGDVAVTYGLYSFQVDSKVGVRHGGASDAHDLVVVKVFCTDRRMQFANATQAAGSSSSAAQPASADQPLSLPPKPTPSASSTATESVPPVVRTTAATEEYGSVSAQLPITDTVLGEQLESLKVGKNKVPTVAKEIQQTSGLPNQDASATSTVTEPVPPVVETSVARDEHASRAEDLAAPRRRNLARPLVSEVFGTDDDTMVPLQDLLEKIAKEFLFGKLGTIVATATGCYETAAGSSNVLNKLEEFLQTVKEQRAGYLRCHPHVPTDAVLSKKQMEQLHKSWMLDYKSWMRADKIESYEQLLKGTGKGNHQKAHQQLRGSFSAFLFQIIGNKHVLLAAIQHPIFSAAQPEIAIEQFMTACDEEKSSKEYQQRKEVSERLTEEGRALKDAAHKARQDLVKARKLSSAHWSSLSSEEQNLLTDFQSGELERIRDDCDLAFGWNQQMRTNMGSTASRMAQRIGGTCRELTKP